MPSSPAAAESEAVVATDRAARYGKQLTAHLGHRLDTSWDDESQTGAIVFPTGRCDVGVTASALLLHIRLGDSAESPAAELDRIEDVVGRHLVRFGAKDELTVAWTRSDVPPE